MGLQISDLWRAPVVNPVNRKARSVPVLNVVDPHGRVFFFSWIGFMIAFWAWYTFPPLLTVTIKADLQLTSAQVANSNIVSLASTLFIRLIAGPLCDQLGPRMVFSLTLLIGSIPIGLAPLIKDATGLYISRFFIGILGGSFVPCQVWCTGWFDKNVVGTANALAGGWGNAGGGITYFIMPAVYDSLKHHFGRSSSEAWRITFVVPLICLIACGLGMLLLCEDTPMGKWSERHNHVRQNLESHGLPGSLVDITNTVTDSLSPPTTTSSENKPVNNNQPTTTTPSSRSSIQGFDHEITISRTEAITTARGETISAPTLSEILSITFSLHALFHALTYACSFGSELAINSILAAYYLKNFPAPQLTQTTASTYAAIFGFMNLVTRPLGGIVGDALYAGFGDSLWRKKLWIHVCGVLTGVFLIVIGTLDPHHLPTMIGLVSLMAVFHEAGNGANFALVPHVYPYANGVVAGLTGAGGNLGGVVFAVVFRFMGDGTDYAKGFWVIGIVHVVVNLAVLWIPPVPRGQVGGG
ncbi:major facilitator superfamily domain-containing protein [Cercophora newfieldiana]|uniref:Nitrate/nitrite transporter n=1 Tax=Cercophora newfieldiana TaxID=92897 RepID=A0AA40CX72_9PEZI|nr:major facilitator superfamily domain-containing protein [Cercophora newfieldiana]